MNKRGISAVVATVLIILITIAAVTIIWTAVIPMIQKETSFGQELVELTIETAGGYSVYDAEQNFATIRIRRGNDNLNVIKLNIIFLVNGTSYSFETPDAPLPNNAKVYSFNFTESGIFGKPSSVSVAPVFLDGYAERVGAISSTIDLSDSGLVMTAEEWEKANNQSLENTLINRNTTQQGLPAPAIILTGIGIQGMVNFDELPYFKENVQVYQFSSYDRTGGNYPGDGFSGIYSYLYKEGSNFVIFDDYGPGGIYQTWMTQGDAGFDTGRILFYFDDESTPRVNITIGELFGGSTSPFLSPLAGTIVYTRNSFVPMLFEKRLKIVMTRQPYFYHFTYHKYDSSVNIESFTGTEDYSAIRNMWNNKSNHPTGNEGTQIASGIENVAVGGTETLIDYSGANYNYISTIKLDISPSDEATIQNAWLRIYWDGESTPSVNAPIGEFFGSGLQEYDIKSLPIGMSTTGYYYSYFPMPFSTRARIEIINNGNSAVSINYTIKAKKDADMTAGINAGYFHAKYNKEFPTQANKDYTFLSTTGRGHYVGVIHTMRGLVSGSEFLEGDERFFIDGSQSPALHGTGTEDYYLGAYYFSGGPYDRAMFGVSSRTLGNSAQYAVYRYQTSDFVPFTNSVNLGIEHGASNDGPLGNYSSVAFYYATDVPSTIKTDELNVGDTTSETPHSYSITGQTWNGTLNLYYPGYDNNVKVAISDNGRNLSNGNTSFRVSINSDNKGIILRRRLDYSLSNQLGNVYVDNQYVGKWYTAGMHDVSNPSSAIRWLDSDFQIPWQFTRGKSSITIKIESGSWNEFYYWVYTKK